MVALTLSNFGGMIPAVDDHLLPDNQAGLSQNAWVYSGAVEGFRAMTSVHTLVNPRAKKAFRVPIQYFDKDHIPDSYWLEFENPDTDVLSSPSVGDQFERYYWAASDVQPQYNTKARIAVGSPSFKLGIPAPTVAPAISFDVSSFTLSTTETKDTFAGLASITGLPGVNLYGREEIDTALMSTTVLGLGPAVIAEARAYVYTWVSAYGEEGPPSPPTLATGPSGGAWNITVTPPDAGVTTGRNIDRVRIYRTITGTSGATTYYFVTEMPVGTLSYIDDNPTSQVASNNILESTFYEPPPVDLKGIIAMPNGIVAGFRENEVWFCEPYLPHAWPSIYTLAVENEIVGLGVVGQSLIVCTTGSPYAISGVNPASMTQSRLAFSEPCLSRGSIISTPIGVAYASPNGVAVAVPGQVQVITRNLINKDKWLDQAEFLFGPSLRATALNGGYYCWGSVLPGCFEATAFDPDNFQQDDFTGAYRGAFIDLNNTRVSFTKLFNELPTFNCYTDTWTGETLIIRDGKVQWLDIAPNRTREPYVWRSKIFSMPNKRNIEAMRVWFDTFTDSPELNPVRNTAPVQTLAADQYGLVRVYADGNLIMTREMREDGEFMRLPSGFKAQHWQIEVEARVRLTEVELATTAKELASV
jgi:hypothetical protein